MDILFNVVLWYDPKLTTLSLFHLFCLTCIKPSFSVCGFKGSLCRFKDWKFWACESAGCFMHCSSNLNNVYSHFQGEGMLTDAHFTGPPYMILLECKINMYIFHVNVKEICTHSSCPTKKQKQVYKLNTSKTTNPLKFKLTAPM